MAYHRASNELLNFRTRKDLILEETSNIIKYYEIWQLCSWEWTLSWDSGNSKDRKQKDSICLINKLSSGHYYPKTITLMIVYKVTWFTYLHTSKQMHRQTTLKDEPWKIFKNQHYTTNMHICIDNLHWV